MTFLGAGSVVFTKDLLRDLLALPGLGGLSVRLYDIDRERLATAEAIAHRVADQTGTRLAVTAHDDLASAVADADFCINMVNVGGHPATVTDFEVPARFGLRQTIGDTLGVGGIFRALRTFPVLDEIAEAMLEHAPDAWLLSYTNPMSMNVTYLTRRHPRLKVLGLCHSVYWTVHDLCDLLGVPLAGTSYRAAGVNHQAWLLDWRHEGRDLYPLLDERIAADPELRRRVRVDLYRRLGRYPTETSEHSSEYVPWYLRHDEEVERLRIPVDDYVGISAGNLEEYADTRARLASGQDLEAGEVGEAGEYAPQVIHSLVTGTPRVIHATVPNTALLPDLAAGLGVEVPVAVDASGPAPVHVGALPPACAALNRAFLGVVDLTVGAAVAGDPRMLRQAAMVDPHTAASLTLDRTWDLVDAMVAAHGGLLPPALRSPLRLEP